MKKTSVAVIAALAGLAACAGAWLAVPMLQPAEQKLEGEAAVAVERARRIFDEYNASLLYRSILADHLDERGIEPTPDELSDALADRYQAIHTALWEAYTPHDFRGDAMSPARPNYGNVAGQIQQGVSQIRQIIAENERILDEATTAVDRALTLTVNGASARTHAEANRLKAAILYHKGLAQALKARLQRLQATPHRRRLTKLAARAHVARALQTSAAQSSLDEQIGAIDTKIEQIEAALRAEREQLAGLEARIENLEAELVKAREARDTALAQLERLKERGVDFSDPRGGELFETRLMALNSAYRDALRRIHALERGTLANAHLGGTGDYLTGEYISLETGGKPAAAPGLDHYRKEREVVAGQVAGLQHETETLRTDRDRLSAMKLAMEARATVAEEQVARSAEQAGEAYASLNRIESEASAIEEDALNDLAQAARLADQAAGYARQWVTDAASRTRGVPPGGKQNSAFASRERDMWMSGYIAAQEADAHLVRALIYYERFDAATRNERVLRDAVDTLALAEVDPQGESAKAAEAREGGVEAVTSAVSALQQAHNNADRHWTLVAQQAGANYLLALFAMPDYYREALEAYRVAIKGREDQPPAEVFATAITRLEGK